MFNLKSILPEFKSEYPFMNEPTAVLDYVTTKPAVTYDSLDWWIERTPEAVSILNAIKTDITADGLRFEGGKQAKNLAEKFTQSQFFKDEFSKCIWDWLVYGDAYFWKGGINKLMSAQKKLKQRFDIDIEIDEDYPRLIKYIPTTTMNIQHDGKKITKFRQSVSGQQDILFPVEDIIHAKMLTNKGKVYGFSPTQACLSEMSILGYLKDYAGNFFKNGGTPDWMFVLPNEMAGSPNHKKLVEMLTKYKHPQRKHGNLVFAGEVEATQIGNDLDKIDVSDNAIYFASVLALAHNMPVSRVAALIGKNVKVSPGGDDLANEGYWNKIAEHQDRWEEWFNTQLFIPFFNVTFKINKLWRTNEIKEQQRNQFALGNLASMNRELARWDKQITLEYTQRQLYLKETDLEKLDEEFEKKQLENQMAGQKPAGGKQLDKLEISRGAATAGMRDEKRKTATITSGFGKSTEFKKTTHLLDKELFFEKFFRWVKESQTRDCYYYTKGEKIYASISTPDEDFKLEISKSDLTPEELTDLQEFGKQTEGTDEQRGDKIKEKEDEALKRIKQAESDEVKKKAKSNSTESSITNQISQNEKTESRNIVKTQKAEGSITERAIKEEDSKDKQIGVSATKIIQEVETEESARARKLQENSGKTEKASTQKIKDIQREENRKYRDMKPKKMGEVERDINKLLKKR